MTGLRIKLTWDRLTGEKSHKSLLISIHRRELPGGSMIKNPPANAGDARDVGSIPGSGRSSGEGNGNPL